MRTPRFIPSSEIPEGLRSLQRECIHENGLSHPLNASGYRSIEFSQRQRINILALGCSYTFGWCLPDRDMWVNMIPEALAGRRGETVGLWNMALPGLSNDHILRLAMTAVPILQPDLVLVCFTQAGRLEYWDTFTSSFAIRPTSEPAPPSWDSHRVEVRDHYTAVQSEAHDEARMYSTYQLLWHFFKVRGIEWACTFACVSRPPKIAEYLDPEVYIGSHFARIDFASDGRHPGPASNRQLADRLLSFLQMRKAST